MSDYYIEQYSSLVDHWIPASTGSLQPATTENPATWSATHLSFQYAERLEERPVLFSCSPRTSGMEHGSPDDTVIILLPFSIRFPKFTPQLEFSC